MNEWSVVLTLGTLLSLLVAVLAVTDRITKPMKDLNNSIIQLTAKFDAQDKAISRLDSENEIAHSAIWSKVNEQGAMLTDHDKTLAIMKDEHDNKQ